MVKQRQLPSWINSLSACKWTVLQNKCTISAPHEPTIMYNSLHAKNSQTIEEQCSVSISHAPHTFIPFVVTSNLWIIASNPDTLGSMTMIICPDKATSTVPIQQPFHILRLSPTCSVTSRYFYLPLHYADHTIMMNGFLDTVNINAINISTPYFRIWQNFNSNWTSPHLQKLANVPEVLVAKLNKHIINTGEPVHSFTIKDHDEDPSFIWTVLTHPGTYIRTIGMIFAVCVGVYCFKRFWIRPSIP